MPLEKTPDLGQYRSYLRVLAEIRLSPRLRVKEDVSDLVQHTLMQAHANLATFRGTTDGELKVWLKTILTRRLINLEKHYAAQKRGVDRELSLDGHLQNPAATELVAEQASPSDQLMRQERAEQLADALAGLLDQEREAVVLKQLHDWTVAEIAEHLGRTEDAVAGLLRRGLKKLRNALPESSSDG